MKSSRVIQLCCFLAPYLFLSPAAGEQAGREVPDLTTDEVVVSATRTPERIDQSAAAVTVFTRQQIERSPYAGGHQVDDLLRSVPGVQPATLSSRYNHPTAQAVSLRGLGTRRSLVLLDGVPLNDGFGGWINWGLVPDRVQRIEVVPGGASSLWGAWAMGGVIHIITEPATTGFGGMVNSQAGNRDTYTQALSVHTGTDRLNLTLGYRWYHSNGYITVPTYQRGPIDQNNDSRHEHFSGAVSAALDSHTTLKLNGTLFREDRSFGTSQSLATRTIGTVALNLTGEPGQGQRYEATIFGQWQTFRNLTSQVVPAPTVRLSEFQNRIQTIPSNDFGGSVQWTSRLSPAHMLVLGGDVRTIIAQSGEDIFTATGSAGSTLAGGQQLGGGPFAEWIYQPIEQLIVTPSVRADWWKQFNAQVVSSTGTTTVPNDHTISVVNPKLSVLYRVTEWMRVGTSAYQGFRAPTLNELYRSFGFGAFTFAANDRLAPERLTGVEGKIEGEFPQIPGLSWRVVGHFDQVKDQVLFVTQAPLLAQRQNVGQTRTVGSEIDVAWRVPSLFTATVGYAYADSTITSFPGNPSREGKFVPNVSRHQVVMGVTVGRPDIVELTIQGRYLSRQYADDANTQPVADFVVIDASIHKPIAKGIRMFLNGENVTNRQYIATQTGSVKTLGVPLLVMGGVRVEY
ncbi:MAG: TonB-dependent receptor [Nitrospiraceae bacterium]